MNEDRLLSDQKKKNSSVFAEPKDPNLTANGGNGYDHKDRQ